ncbi:hypothetical protein [Paenibacillus melissococcoides]|uniref:hypothetical protein n=1 Tax=Paenibacillus melissococcoides TaxID=2912268 RepID=UPI0021C49180|nr:hypothetical protein [Paenibacillus melissococcoides]CAH8721328.1 hypothetical protein HTL2_006309 [Paenibacillus melissococcoides]
MREWIELLTTPGFVFEEAVAFFGDKLPMKESEFYQLAEEYRAQAFTISDTARFSSFASFTGNC